MIRYLTLILGCQLAGETLTLVLSLPLPGPVLGMALLFAGLCVGGLPDGLARLGDALLANLALLFVPAGVGVMLHGRLLAEDGAAIAIALVASTALTIIVTGLAMRALAGPLASPDGGPDDGPDGGKD